MDVGFGRIRVVLVDEFFFDRIGLCFKLLVIF